MQQMISSIRQREVLPVAVKSEPDEVQELESVPFNIRVEMTLGREPIPGSFVDEEDNKDDHVLQENKIKTLQMCIAQLEQQLADSSNLAAERLSKITELEASLKTVSHERDVFKAESLKWRSEIISFIGKVKHLEKQDYGSLDTKAPILEVDMSVPQASTLSQTDNCQDMESEQMQHQHVSFKQHVGDLSTGLPCEREICTSTLVVPPMESVPDNVSSIEANVDVDCMTSLSSPLKMDEVHEVVASVAAGSLSCHEMQTGHNCVALRDDENVLPDTINSQNVPLLNSTRLEPMRLLGKTVVKKEIIPVVAHSLAEENSDTMQKIGGPSETLASNSPNGTDYENQCLPTLAMIFEETDNNEKVYHHVNAPDKLIQVKVENVYNCVEGPCERLLMADTQLMDVKRDMVEENNADDLDHVLLKERLKLLVAIKSCGTGVYRHLNCSQQSVAFYDSAIFATAFQEDGTKTMKDLVKAAEVSGSEHHHLGSVIVNANRLTLRKKKKKIGMDAIGNKHEAPDVKNGPFDSVKLAESGHTHRRKRKKTATDNIETALEEDAPGLLQVLMDSGVNVDEIKLYGAAEDEDPVEITDEAGFTELEVVISKLFTQSSSLLKFAPLRHTKGSRVNYCLACLVSLVEQTRYLQFRKWPVEWGWCRDLQSFIFVFEKHNRIVLERPEYGFATYFFELVGSFPIDWQIKRLVTAMKLASFSRVSLIENKPLSVGDDLTEREAQMLEEYGWIPDTGLGTMLNYCDRVVHDKNIENSSEWRSKIGRLLREGYDGGTKVTANLPKKVIEYKGLVESRVKLEI